MKFIKLSVVGDGLESISNAFPLTDIDPLITHPVIVYDSFDKDIMIENIISDGYSQPIADMFLTEKVK